MTPAAPAGDRDPGLARERTELAWTRTAISYAALGAAVLKVAPAGGVLVLAIGATAWRTGRLPGGAVSGPGQARRLRLITASITAIAAAALIVSYLVPSLAR